MTDRTLPGRAGPHPPPGQPPPATAARRLEPPPWLGVTQGLRLPWLVAIVAVCAVGVVLADLEGSARPRLLLLLAAPLLPMLCVAGSYSGKADPFAEVTRTTPAGGLRILLMRTCQVLTLCVPLLTVAAALMPREGFRSTPPWDGCCPA
ncbi:hypothetical protein ACFQ0X_15495 [Streptomyces rectiviolaceus]|uniref:hypothetical protein n=1 Tax=Streptomyces rectiviolaceus TaxID=332591 RepID=UPI0036405CCA